MPQPTVAVHANVAASTSSVALFTATTNQVAGRSVFNDSAALLRLKYGATASSTSFAVQIAAGGYFEFPLSNGLAYNGAVEGIWASATGTARCTELS